MRRPPSPTPWIALVVLAWASVGCTLLLPYGDPVTESGDDLCQDRLDNDGDGATDCEDTGCGECVGLPSLSCPPGWSELPADAATLPAIDCAAPEQPWLDGCPTTAPRGATIIAAQDDALGAVLVNTHATDPSGPPVEVWLAPGTHLESAALLPTTGHVVVHGLCADGVAPVLSAVGNAGPIQADPDGRLALEIDHVDLRLGPSGPAWTGALTLDHVRVGSADPSTSGVMRFGERSGVVARFASLELPITFDGDGRLTVTDSRIAGVEGRVHATLTRVDARGDLSIAGPGALTASSLFVHCGAVALTDGAGAEIHGGVIDLGPGGLAAIRSAGAVAFRSTVTLEDVLARTTTTCPPILTVASGYTRTDLRMTRVRLADSPPLLLEDGTVATLLDVTIDSRGRGTGMLVGATLDADRIRVTGAQLAAIRVEPTSTNASARLRHVYLDEIGTSNDDPCAVSSAAGVLAGEPALSGVETIGVADVSIESSHFTRVQGCAIYASEGASVVVASTEIGTSTFGLCAPGARDPMSIGAGLAFTDDGTHVTTDTTICAGIGCGTASSCEAVRLTNVDSVDLLLMVDDSNSMTEEQLSLVQEVPRLVEVLVTGDLDADGTADFTPVRSLHVGIVDSDMGLGGITGVVTCDPGFGDDGVMQFRTRVGGAGCAADYSVSYPNTPNVFDFAAGGARTAAAFAEDVGCVALVGTAGCGFEFELEAPLKALSLAPNPDGTSPVSWTRAGYRPPTFWGGTYGHGNDPMTNGSFLRPDSALAIVTINDEDDCSTPNFALFSLDNPAYSGVGLNLRCSAFASELYPISRYVDGFIGLRRDPSLLIYAAITGVPLALSGMDPAIILADPTMQNTPDPVAMDRLVPVCTTPGRGVAYPARRMTELAAALHVAGASATVQSICAADFSSQIDAVLGLIGDTTSAACFPRALSPSADGTVNCDLYELLPVEGEGVYAHCADLPNSQAYVRVGIEASTGREICRVVQVDRAGAGSQPGWIYDDGTIGAFSSLPVGCTQRLAFSVVSPVPGAEARLTCMP